VLTPRCPNTYADADATLRARATADAAIVVALLPGDVVAASPSGRASVAELHRALGYGRTRRRPC